MAIGRGETVGEAYIRIHADGSGLAREIKDQFADSQNEAEDAGARRGTAEEEAYTEARKKQRDKDGKVRQRETIETIQRERGQRRALEEYLAGREGRAIRNAINKEVGRGGGTGGKELADRIFDQLARRARERGSTKIFSDMFGQIDLKQGDEEDDAAYRKRVALARQRQNDLFAQLRRDATKEILRDEKLQAAAEARSSKERQAAMRAEAEYMNRAHDSRLRQLAEVRRAEHDAYREQLTRDRQREVFGTKLIRLERLKNSVANEVFANQSYYNRGYATRSRDQFNAEYALAKQRAEATNDYSHLNRLITERNVLLGRYNSKLSRGNGLVRGGIRDQTRFERSLNRGANKLEDRLSRLDNALIGKRPGRIRRMIGATLATAARTIFQGAYRNLQRLARGLGNVFDIVRGPGTLASKALKLFDLGVNSLLKGMTNFVKSVGKGFAALNAFFLLLGPVASTLSMLAGGISAFSGSVILGLAAGIGQLLPLLPVLLTGVGVLALGFAKLTKAQKAALGVRLKPLKVELDKLRESARSGLLSDLPRQVKLGSRALQLLTPLIRETGKALSKGVFTNLLKGLTGSRFQSDLKVLNKFIPDAITRLGSVFRDLFVGLAGYFRILSPYTTDFLKGLQASAAAFNKFTHSADGKNQIEAFMDRSLKSLEKVKLTLKLTYRVLRDLFFAGQSTGDSLIDSLNSSLDRFDKYLTNPKNSKVISGYFRDVKQFFSSLGTFIGGIGRLFDKLDDATSRSSANGILKAVGGFGEVVGDALPVISAFQRGLKEILTGLSGPLSDLFKNLRPIVRDVADMIAKFTLIAADLIVVFVEPIIVALGKLAKFVSNNKTIFQPLILALIGLKLAFVLNGIATIAPTAIGVAVLRIRAAIAAGTAGIRSSALTLGKVMGGVGLILAGQAAGDAIGGTGGKAVSILGAAAGGALAGSAFGPWGAAIGGLLGGIGGAIVAFRGMKGASESAKAKIAQDMRDNTEAVDVFTEALKKSKGRIGPDVRTEALNRLDKKGTLGTLTDVGVDPNKFLDAGLGNADKYFAMAQQLRTLTDAGRLTEKQYKSLIGTLDQTGDALYTATKRNIAWQRVQDKGMGSLPNITKLVKAYGSQLDLTGLKLNAATKDASYQTIAGAKNTDAIRRQLSVYQQAADKNVKLGKSAIGVKSAYDASRSSFKSRLIDLGFQAGAVDLLFKTYGKLPASVTTKLKADDQASARIGNLQTMLRNYPLNKETKLIARDIASGKISSVGQLLSRLRDKNVRVSATTRGISELERLRNLMYNIAANPNINVSATARGSSSGVRPFARGGLLARATRILAGEAGPEAIVPLRRPLSQVDPSVRALSAFAQGKSLNNTTPKFASGGVVGGGKTINIGEVNVITPSRDPRAVAAETVSAIAARAGIG